MCILCKNELFVVVTDILLNYIYRQNLKRVCLNCALQQDKMT